MFSKVVLSNILQFLVYILKKKEILEKYKKKTLIEFFKYRKKIKKIFCHKMFFIKLLNAIT